MRRPMRFPITLLPFAMFLLAPAALRAQAAERTAVSVERGRAIYQALCTQCHGVNGNGWGLNAPHMEVLPRNHIDTKEMMARTDDELFKVIKEGGPSINKSVFMPSWKNNLADAEIRDLVAYLRQICCSEEAIAAAAASAPAPLAGGMGTAMAAPPPQKEIDLGPRYNPEAHGNTPVEPSIPLPPRIKPDVPFHHFEMTIEELAIEVAPGFKTKVWAFNGQVPGPLIHVGEGDEIVVNVQNNTTLNHTIHWHGTYQTNSWKMDGVPHVTQQPIEPGENFQYHFIADKPGSLWYHCHVNVPEHVGLRGMWGPMIVDPKHPTDWEKEVTKDAVLMFSAWNSDVAANLGTGGHPREVPNYFSVNAKSFPLNQPLRVKKLDTLRLRLYGASMDVAFHLHGHDMLVTHKDGLPLDSPYWADVVYVPFGGRVDVIVRMYNEGRWMTHDHIEHHVSNNGVDMGGNGLVVEYEGVPMDDWYAWKDKEYEPDFYLSESLKKPHGLHETPAFRGFHFEGAGTGVAQACPCGFEDAEGAGSPLLGEVGGASDADPAPSAPAAGVERSSRPSEEIIPVSVDEGAGAIAPGAGDSPSLAAAAAER